MLLVYLSKFCIIFALHCLSLPMTIDEISPVHEIFLNKEKFWAISEIDADGQQLMYMSLIEIIPHTCFRVNPHSIVAWMSRNSLLKAGTKSEN